jgi:hypothetical protein
MNKNLFGAGIGKQAMVLGFIVLIFSCSIVHDDYFLDHKQLFFAEN